MASSSRLQSEAVFVPRLVTDFRHSNKASEEGHFSDGQEYLKKNAVVSQGFIVAFHKRGDTQTFLQFENGEAA